ncbi:hypothetical protein CIT292_10574 [Citrobacter youngae ATCC 29220]|uniref:Uncharacterized protein n=1 Tax=Citrobacter youngae ATCC 29220 TaxID=500640 RepID=D4BJ57_9ENTR|nr:hypothetical protein CIT292_10574 [Citrobacter youngae ATCC 29220]
MAGGATLTRPTVHPVGLIRRPDKRSAIWQGNFVNAFNLKSDLWLQPSLLLTHRVKRVT